MNFYIKNKPRFTYEYANFKWSEVEKNNYMDTDIKIAIMDNISKYFSAFAHDLISVHEYMSCMSNVYSKTIDEITSGRK